MIRQSQRLAFHSLVYLAVAACWLFLCAVPARAQKEKALSKAAQEKIEKALSESPRNKVTVFNHAGDETAGVTINQGQAQKYSSLQDFLKSDDESPAKSCNDPVPTPPPPCIICSSGQVVCSKASFSANPQSRSHSESDSNRPADEKPQ